MAKESIKVQTLKQYAERICRLEAEKEALTADINEIYDEANKAQFDKKALKAAIKAKRKEIEKNYKIRVNEYLSELGEPDLFAV